MEKIGEKIMRSDGNRSATIPINTVLLNQKSKRFYSKSIIYAGKVFFRGLDYFSACFGQTLSTKQRKKKYNKLNKEYGL